MNRMQTYRSSICLTSLLPVVCTRNKLMYTKYNWSCIFPLFLFVVATFFPLVVASFRALSLDSTLTHLLRINKLYIAVFFMHILYTTVFLSYSLFISHFVFFSVGVTSRAPFRCAIYISIKHRDNSFLFKQAHWIHLSILFYSVAGSYFVKSLSIIILKLGVKNQSGLNEFGVIYKKNWKTMANGEFKLFLRAF